MCSTLVIPECILNRFFDMNKTLKIDSQPILDLYSSAQANSAHVFRCGIGQIKCAELVKRVIQMNDITKHAILKKHILTTNSTRLT